jgi:hypothetical protein
MIKGHNRGCGVQRNCCDPEIIGRNWCPLPAKYTNQLSVALGQLRPNSRNPAAGLIEKSRQLSELLLSASAKNKPCVEFPEHHGRYDDDISFLEKVCDSRITAHEGSVSVRIEANLV